MRKLLFFTIVAVLTIASCSNPRPTKTIENLKVGIIEETTSSAKYTAFAKKAKDEGYNNIAKLFEAASKSELFNAYNHTKVLERLGEKPEDFTPEYVVKSTSDNFKEIFDNQTYVIEVMYPQFIADAQNEEDLNAQNSFTWAMKVEKNNQLLYKKAIEMLNAKSENTLPFQYSVCPDCGNIYVNGISGDKCEICQTEKFKFISI